MYRRSKICCKRILLIFSFLFISTGGQANEGGGAASAPAENISYEDKKQQERTKEWMDVVSSLSALKTKIRSKEDTIKEIIHHKHSAKNKAHAESLVSELLREHKELTKLLEEYNESAQLLKYRYPDVGITEKRKYEKLEIKSLSDYEESQTMESQLKKTVSKVKTHYGVKDDKKTAGETEKKSSIDNNYLAQPKILKK